LGGCSPKVCGSGALRPNRALVMPIQVFDRSLNVPSAVRQWRTSKSGGGAGVGGAVSVSNRLRQRKSTRNDNKFTTATGNGRRCQTRKRLTMRKTAAMSPSKKFAIIPPPLPPTFCDNEVPRRPRMENCRRCCREPSSL
jgi:hypothetical protein